MLLAHHEPVALFTGEVPLAFHLAVMIAHLLCQLYANPITGAQLRLPDELDNLWPSTTRVSAPAAQSIDRPCAWHTVPAFHSSDTAPRYTGTHKHGSTRSEGRKHRPQRPHDDATQKRQLPPRTPLPAPSHRAFTYRLVLAVHNDSLADTSNRSSGPHGTGSCQVGLLRSMCSATPHTHKPG